MRAEARNKNRAETGKAFYNTAPFFNLCCQTDALSHFTPAAKT